MGVVDHWRVDLPFGGKTIVFGGDFRQILPVIPKGSRQDIVNTTINSSYLWKYCVVLKLTINMRLQSIESDDERFRLKVFADWIASVGDGTLHAPNDGYGDMNIPDNLLVKDFNNPIVAIVESTYPGYGNGDYQLSSLKDTAILAPTLDVVDSVNEYMVALNNSEGRVYLCSDSPCQFESTSNILNDIQIPEFLNSIKGSGMPNHELQLKIGTPVMLLRNIDHSLGLCNGTRLLITRLGDHVLEGQVILKDAVGALVLIPRLSLTPSDPRIPFKFQRRQFPLMVSYAMSINKSQSQSLSSVGLLLKKPVFTHGQLYVALSRVTNPAGLKILICDPDDSSKSCSVTTNVVYNEVFNNV